MADEKEKTTSALIKVDKELTDAEIDRVLDTIFGPEKDEEKDEKKDE